MATEQLRPEFVGPLPKMPEKSSFINAYQGNLHENYRNNVREFLAYLDQHPDISLDEAKAKAEKMFAGSIDTRELHPFVETLFQRAETE